MKLYRFWLISLVHLLKTYHIQFDSCGKLITERQVNRLSILPNIQHNGFWHHFLQRLDLWFKPQKLSLKIGAALGLTLFHRTSIWSLNTVEDYTCSILWGRVAVCFFPCTGCAAFLFFKNTEKCRFTVKTTIVSNGFNAIDIIGVWKHPFNFFDPECVDKIEKILSNLGVKYFSDLIFGYLYFFCQ